jgi:hypothetical protein
VRVGVEPAPPCAVAKHRDVGFLRVVYLSEDAAHERRNAQHGENGGRDARGNDLCRLANSGELVVFVAKTAEALKRAGIVLVSQHLRRAHPSWVAVHAHLAAAHLIAQGHEAAGVVKRQRA